MCNSKKCKYCDGTGYRGQFEHVDNGICYKCEGSGFSDFNGDAPIIGTQTREFKTKIKAIIKNICRKYWDSNKTARELPYFNGYWEMEIEMCFPQPWFLSTSYKNRVFPNLPIGYANTYSMCNYDGDLRHNFTFEVLDNGNIKIELVSTEKR